VKRELAIAQARRERNETQATESKQVEDALRLSEAKFSTAFRVSPDAIAINRLTDGLYLEVNEGLRL